MKARQRFAEAIAAQAPALATTGGVVAMDELIADVREQYALGRCSLEELEEAVERILTADFPLPPDLARRTLSTPFWPWPVWDFQA